MKNFLMRHGDDILILAGCSLVLVGVYKVSPVATWFAAGGMCILGGIVIGLAGGKQ
jgi:hypothetical protein